MCARTAAPNHPKWIGHCPACKEWNTYREELITLFILRRSLIRCPADASRSSSQESR
ncbi:MAG: DNA repair protein RadA [Marinilabiliales bacterium]|nr:DNA repair protein RadA [Marinilabiliales bacterium]